MADDSVEFIDDPGEPRESNQAAVGSPGAGGSRMFDAIAGACWLAAAVLAIAAPFRALYRENVITGSPDSLNDTPDATLAGFDGWGRSLLDGDPAGIGAQFGIALLACAALLLILPSVLR